MDVFPHTQRSSPMSTVDSFAAKQNLEVGGTDYEIFALDAVEGAEKLPYSLKILLENLLRTEDGANITADHVRALASWEPTADPATEIQFTPARVIMQDFTGVPCVVDLATMREAMEELGGDPEKINPLAPAEMVIDHSVMIDVAGRLDALEKNMELEYERNRERYQFLRWGQTAFDDFKVVPPGTGIVHQVNIEYLARTVMTREVSVDGGAPVLRAYPDSCVGTDSHTTMVNGLGVLGWGVGGIEAEAAMLGQPVSMLIPEVVGFKLTGKLKEGITATDLVLTVTEMLRKRGVVGKFVEYYGDGLADLPLADRATIANMAPEYGATCGFFPVDDETLAYLRLTGRDEAQIALVEAYCKAQGLWREPGAEPVFSDSLHLDLGDVEASLAGPKRPQDRVALRDMQTTFEEFLAGEGKTRAPGSEEQGRLLSEGGQTAVGVHESYEHHDSRNIELDGNRFMLNPGAVVIAAITSCTNTSNPSVMLAAGLLARNARAKGLTTQPWVKTSLAPGSKVVTEYLAAAGVQDDLDALGFHLVGYGCTTCIGNSGPLPPPIEAAIEESDLTVAAVLSGNRNFEGRIHPLTKTNWLASPPLVVAYALAGNVRLDLTRDPLGEDQNGNPVYLKDIWPSQADIAAAVEKVKTDIDRKEYAAVFDGDEIWQALQVPQSQVYEWSPSSTYIQHPPFFEGIRRDPDPIEDVK